MITDAVNANQLAAELLVEELVRLGVTAFFIAPGSRSTPIVLAAARHPKAECFVHFDERGSAFAALGYGRATLSPAAWVTTSGTAVANGLPAVVEASTDGVPLVAITADRPPELRKTGANQTIEQPGIFGSYPRWSFDLPPWDPGVNPVFLLTTIDQAVHRSVADLGPVHLNCMFREPLVPEPDPSFEFNPGAQFARWLDSSRPFTGYSRIRHSVPADEIRMLAEQCRHDGPGLVVAGRLRSEQEGAAVESVAKRLGWPLFSDVLSFTSGSSLDEAVGYFDLLIASSAFRADFRPRTVLHFGGRATSKGLYRHLEEASPEHFVLVSPIRDRVDPIHGVSRRVEADVTEVCAQLLESLEAEVMGERPDSLVHLNAAVGKMLDHNLPENGPVSEPFIARHVSRHIPGDHALFVGSSMPARDVDSYSAPSRRLNAFGNRGASGIDGTLATAFGIAVGRRGPVTVLLGDLAQLHDLNSLALVRSSSHPIVIVVVNNDGGGIFSFLPIAGFQDEFEEYFGTPHGLNFEDAARMFGLPYHIAGEAPAFTEAYRALCDARTSGLIEVRTDRIENRRLHEDLVEDVCAIVEDVLVPQPSPPNRV